jgi:hypothetical protein
MGIVGTVVLRALGVYLLGGLQVEPAPDLSLQ